MSLAESIKEQMDNLTKYKKGQSFSIRYVERGEIKRETMELDSVRPFSFMKFLDGTRIPFLGNNIAVIQIFANGFKAYENGLVNESYGMDKSDKIRIESGFSKPKNILDDLLRFKL
jgi:hypothetical protein